MMVIFYFIVMIYRNDAVNHVVFYVDRKLIVDNFFVIASFSNGSLNCEIFEYLNKNKDRKITVDELQENVFRGREVNFSKIIDAMGINGDMKRILFTCARDSITYHPYKIRSERHIRVN